MHIHTHYTHPLRSHSLAVTISTLSLKTEGISRNWRNGIDLWIAASAMQHGLILVTTDTHFEKVPQISKEILPRP